MKKQNYTWPTTWLVMVLAVAVNTSFGQATVEFANYTVTLQFPIYDVEPGDPTVEKHGNTSAGIPAGGQTYGGAALVGDGFFAELWGKVGTCVPVASLEPLARKTFRTGSAAGFFNSPGQVDVPNAPVNGNPPYGTFQIRVWKNAGGTITSWAAAEMANPPVPHGASEVVTVPLGGTGRPPSLPPPLTGMTSFNLHLGGIIPPSPLLVVLNNNDSGFGSLRQAILDVPVYVPVCDTHTIAFAPNVTGTITLTSGELVIGKNLVINGPGAKLLTVSGNIASRVFRVTGGESVIANLRIANGNTEATGGGVAVTGGSLTLSNCTVAGCYADNIFGGGGISVGPGILSIIGSTIVQNRTPAYGGGISISFDGVVDMFNSTVSGNSSGGGFIEAYGGGISVGNGSLGVIDSTIANNSSANFGGGIYYDSRHDSVAIRDSLIAGNRAPTGPDCNGAFVSNGYNLIGNTSGSSGFGSTGDLLNLDPRMGPLQDNGGPTFTHALLPGSPAIDKGGIVGLTTDQRGGIRHVDKTIANASGGDGSDIGAFESGGFCGITSVRRAGNDIRINFTTDLGNSYALQWRDNIASGAWAAIGSSMLGSGGILEAADNRPLVTKRFYRIKAADQPTQVFYSNNFEGAVGAEWNVPQAASTTPVGGRKFLGEFANAIVTLQLANLPPHTHLSVSFDLLILKSWDGNRTDFGPDRWRLSVRGGATLVDTTFTLDPAGLQAYPGAFGASYPGLTGAAEHNTLGYTFSGVPSDSVYRPTVTFAHTAPSVTLDFSGLNLQDIADESWGLDNVRVEVITLP